MHWITTNFSDRLINPSLDLQVNIKDSKFEKICFEQAVDNTALKIANSTDKKIFIGFSGGYDSELIVRTFHKLNIKFYPIMVDLEGCDLERSYANMLAKELNLDVITLKLSLKDYIRYYYEVIFKKINGSCEDVRPFICQYIQKENGIFIDGATLVGDGEERVLNYDYYCREYPFYAPTLFPNVKTYNFLFHTPEIVIAMLEEACKDETWSEYKERVFKVKYRPKMRGFVDSQYQDILDTIKTLRKHKPKSRYYFGKKEQLMSLILNTK